MLTVESLTSELGLKVFTMHDIDRYGMHRVVEEAIEMEAQAQAICMQTQDFKRAYHAFVAKQKPVFEGN